MGRLSRKAATPASQPAIVTYAPADDAMLVRVPLEVVCRKDVQLDRHKFALRTTCTW